MGSNRGCELAREPGHPDADTSVACVIIAPLDAVDLIDPALWRKHREACRIARLRPDRQDDHGHLVHRQGGGWALHDDAGTKVHDEIGFQFADQRFAAGEYVSINEGRPGWQAQLVFIMMLVQTIDSTGMAFVVLVAASSRLGNLVVPLAETLRRLPRRNW